MADLVAVLHVRGRVGDVTGASTSRNGSCRALVDAAAPHRGWSRSTCRCGGCSWRGQHLGLVACSRHPGLQDLRLDK